MDKSRKKNEQFMNKLWTDHEQIKSQEQVIDNSCVSQQQVLNKWWTGDEKVMNK